MKYCLLGVLFLFVLYSCRELPNDENLDEQKVTLPGKLDLNSNPAKAKIFIDDYDSGKVTRDTLINLYPGTYRIRLLYDSLRDSTIKVEVKSGITKYVYVNFKYKPI